jgi:hypothetical protein
LQEVKSEVRIKVEELRKFYEQIWICAGVQEKMQQPLAVFLKLRLIIRPDSAFFDTFCVNIQPTNTVRLNASHVSVK